MNQRKNHLRLCRIILASVVFTILTVGILFPQKMPGIFLTQAGSDVLAVVANASIGAAAALAGILLMTLIVGRVYCSVLCPLGILQDILGVFRFRKYRNMPWKKNIRGPVFWLTIVSAACGFLLPLTLLMPSSNFVAICNHVFRELVQTMDSAVGFLPEPLTLEPNLPVQIAAWAILLLLLFLVHWNGRVFCDTLCPVGAG